LIPYYEEDAPFFFGRELERKIIIANLMASRLTLFYGPSGVGKSSILNAGVVHHFQAAAEDNRSKDGSRKLAVVAFREWGPIDPIPALVRKVDEVLSRDLGDRESKPTGADRGLMETLHMWEEHLRGSIYILLDQFEEYFVYPRPSSSSTFADDLAEVIRQRKLPVNFLISIRDDALAKLDHFEGTIPNLFDNYIRIEHLTREGAREAINGPIEEYNRRCVDPNEHVEVEALLADAVLDQVQAGRVYLGQAGRGVAPTSHQDAEADARVEAPYLQLVMTALWDEEVSHRSHKLQLGTLNRLGGSVQIVRTHLDNTLNTLPGDDQDVAAAIFRFLVTPSGSKIAHTAADLAEYSIQPVQAVKRVLGRLAASDTRILRQVASPTGGTDDVRYEIFHDVLAPAVLDWRTRHELSKAADAKSRAERWAGLASATTAFLLLGTSSVTLYSVLTGRSISGYQFVVVGGALLVTILAPTVNWLWRLRR